MQVLDVVLYGAFSGHSTQAFSYGLHAICFCAHSVEFVATVHMPVVALNVAALFSHIQRGNEVFSIDSSLKYVPSGH